MPFRKERKNDLQKREGSAAGGMEKIKGPVHGLSLVNTGKTGRGCPGSCSQVPGSHFLGDQGGPAISFAPRIFTVFFFFLSHFFHQLAFAVTMHGGPGPVFTEVPGDKILPGDKAGDQQALLKGLGSEGSQQQYGQAVFPHKDQQK
jgi:hypothetical protein